MHPNLAGQPIVPVSQSHNLRQKLLSLSIGIAITSSTSVNYALANVATIPTVPTVSHTQTQVHNSSATANVTTQSTSHAAAHFQQATSVHPVAIAHTAAQSAVQSASQSPHDLNLASTKTIFAPNTLANFSTLTIDVGGKAQTVPMQGKLLTAAELLAAEQVLSGQKQTITINAKGEATGGVFDLSKSSLSELDDALSGSLGSLYVPTGVKIVDSLSSLTLSGNLTNYGTILAAASGTKSADTISASYILNEKGGSIASLPTSAVHSGLNPASLILQASEGLANSGTINSSGSLVVASPTIVNRAGTISSQQQLSLQTASLTNSGLISSAHGNVDIDSAGNINVFGTHGTIQAAQGEINFRDASYSGAGNITLNGGNYLSNAVNLYSGIGDINANLGNVTGVVNATANSAHIGAATANLNLGKIDTAGDPTYFNTSGNILIDSSITSTGGQPLAIIAAGNIIGGGGVLDTSNASGSGGDLILVAGANFAVDSGLTTNPAGGDQTSTLTISGNSATGGYIDLAGILGGTGAKAVTALTTSSGTGQAGNVTLVAYAGTAANSGSIIMPGPSGTAVNSLLNAAGATSAQNGDVTIIGNGLSPNGAILLGDVTARNVSVYGGAPTINGPLTVSNGAITGGSFSPPTLANLSNTYVQTGNITASGAVNMASAGQIVTGNITSPAGTVTLTSTGSEVDTGNITVAGVGGAAATAGQNGGIVTIKAASGIFTGNIDASGGGGGGGNGNGGTDSNGGAGGAGGSISLTAMGDNVQVGTLNVSGGGGGGGAGATASVAAGTGGAGGAGGTISISTPYSVIGEGAMLAFNGGAGGAGSNAVVIDSNDTLGGAGGGGGGAYGGGGGGGAAGLSTSQSISATLVANGGGGGAGVYGGGGGAAVDNLGLSSGGGAGGSSYAAGIAGAGEFPGTSGSTIPTSQEGGSGGNSDTSGILPTASGGYVYTGGQGGSSGVPTTGQSPNQIIGAINTTAAGGANATTIGGSGTISVGFGATSYAGTPTVKQPIELDAAQLSIIGTKNAASINININTDGTQVVQATVGGSSTLQINAYGNLILTGPTSAGTIILNNDGPGLISTSGTTLSAFFGNLNATRGDISVYTAFDSLTLTGSGQAITVNNANPYNHPLVLTGTNLGELNLTTSGSLVEAAGKTLTGDFITINAGGNIGTATVPFVTSASDSLSVNVSPNATAYLKDTFTGTLNFTGGSTVNGQAGLAISLTSSAKLLNVTNVIDDNVTLKDTNTAGSITIDPNDLSTAQIGSGSGTVSISAVGNINFENAPTMPGIIGTSIDLISTLGSVGQASGTLSTSYVQINGNGQTGTLTGSGKEGFYILYDGDLTAHNITGSTISLVTLTGTNGQLTLSGPIGNSLTTQIYLVGDTALNTINTTSTVIGKNVQLSLRTGGDIGSSTLPIVTEAGALNLYGSASGLYVTGSSADVRQIGSVNLGTIGAYDVSITSTGTITGVSGGELYAANNLSLYGATGLNIEANDPVLAAVGNYSIGTGHLTLNGTLYDTTATTFSSTLGSLQILGTGSITSPPANSGNNNSTGLGSSLTLSAKGNITVLPTDPLGTLQYNSSIVQQLTISAGGVYSSPFTSYTVLTDSNENAGSINLTASSLAFSPGVSLSGPIVLTAQSGADYGNGGTVTVKITGTSPVAVTTETVPKGTTAFEIFADSYYQGSSGNSGTISVSAAGNLFVADDGFNAFGTSGNGQNLSFSSGRDLSLNVDFTSDTAAITAGANNGTINLSSGALLPFSIGTTGNSAVTNGSVQAITGSNVTIKDLLGIINNLGVTATGTSTAPGQLLLQTANMQNNNSLTAENSGQLQVINPSGSLAITTTTNGAYVGATSVDLEAQHGNLTLNNFFAASAVNEQLNSITLVATDGKVIFPAGQTSLSAAPDSNGNGGTIQISASSLSFQTGSNFTFNANGSGSGNGGTVSITTISPLTVGTSSGNIAVNVTAGTSADAGSIMLKSTGVLTVNGNSLSYGTGDTAGTGVFSATGSTLALSNVMPIVSGSLNQLTLVSDSTAALTLGSATTNGIKDAIANSTISANYIDIENNLGTIANDKTGAVTLSANNDLTLRAYSTIAPFTVSTPIVDASSRLGSITLTLAATSPTTLLDSLSTSSTQSITLNLNSNGATAGTATITTGKLDLTGTGAIQGNVITSAATIEGSSSGNTSFTDFNKSTVSVAGFDSGGAFALSTGAGISVTGAISAVGSATLNAGGLAGGINFNKTGSLNVSGLNSVATLTSSGTGAVFSTAAANIVTASEVILTGGTVTPTYSLRTAAATFDLNGGALNILNTYDGSVTLNAPKSLVALKFDTVAPTLASTSTFTINSVAATKGSISIIGNSATMNVGSSAEISTVAGGITLQNLDTLGTIKFGTNAIVSAYDATPSLGSVTITIGAVTSPRLAFNYQSVPVGLNVDQVSGGVAYLGGKTANAVLTVNGSGNELIAQGASLTLNAAGNALAITLAGGDQIIADPPALQSSSFIGSLSAAVAAGGLSGNVLTGNGQSANGSPVVIVPLTNSAAANSTLATPTFAGQGVSLNSVSTGGSVNFSVSPPGISSKEALSAAVVTATGVSTGGLLSSLVTESGGLLSAGLLNSTTASTANLLANSLSAILNTNIGSGTLGPVHGAAKNRTLSGIVSNLPAALDNGATLIDAVEPRTIETEFGNVAIAKNALVLLVAFDGGIALYNLHDTGHNSVTINHGNTRISVSPGQHLLLTSNKVNYFEDTNIAPHVAYRRLVARDLGDGVKSFFSEFNILSMIAGIDPLRHLVNASDSQSRKTSQKILKTAAILAQMSGSSTPYELMTATPIAAEARQ